MLEQQAAPSATSSSSSSTRTATTAAGDAAWPTPSRGTEWWNTPATDYVAPAQVDPAVFGIEADDVGVAQPAATAAKHGSSPPIRHPDETPVTWTSERQAPPNPVQPIRLDVGSAPTIPAQRDAEAASAPHNRHVKTAEGPISLVGEPDVYRHQYWSAFTSTATSVQGSHDAMRTNLAAIQHAERDPQLGALGYATPAKWKGDIATLTEMQRVPLENGATVGRLFGGDNDLDLNAHDRSAIANGAGAVAKGRGGENGIQMRGMDTQKSDARLNASIAELRGATVELQRLHTQVLAAASAVESHSLEGQAEDVRADIEGLQADAGTAREIVETVGNVLSAVAYAASGEVGDTIDKVGVIAATLLGHLNDGKVARARARLDKLTSAVRTAKGRELGASFQATVKGVAVGYAGVEATTARVEEALTDRRIAYNKLALTTASELPCPESSRAKISGALAAIPLVEFTLARFARLSDASLVPPHNEFAARGLGMARAHGRPVAERFLRACGELAYTRLWSTSAEGDWQERLDALVAVKTQILGRRPGND